jgi:ActR/RegA family two-component response regulator
MRDAELKCDGGRGGAMLSSVCGRIQLFIVLIVGGGSIATGETARPPSASVYLISPKDGDTVVSPFRVRYGLSGMGVAPAGVDTANNRSPPSLDRCR